MYEKFFYFKEKPFHITPDPKFLYLSGKHREAIDLMGFGVSGRKGFMLMTGEVGTGKTTLCRALLEKLPEATESALILNPVVSDHELLKTITADFGLSVLEDTVKAHLDALNGFLLRTSASGGNAVVIIDEAQNLSPSTLEMVRLLSNLETEKEKLLQIILAGQPELKTKLAMPGLRQLNQRIIVRHNLDPLDHAETGEYINNRLKVAGGADSVGFTVEAVSIIHEKTGGIPRMINIVCDRALTAAFVEERRCVDASIARKAVDELERDGYLVGRASEHDDPGPAYRRYMPQIAITAFFIAVIAGMLLGPRIIG